MSIGMSNPAAKYATEMGYEYEVVNTGAGQQGVVTLPDGEQLDEWSFYSGESGREYSYCAKMGWTLTANPKKDGFNNECATCKLPDGSEKTISQLLDIEKKVKSIGTIRYANPRLSSTGASEGDTSVVSLGLPGSFDWRNTNGGDWMTPVKDQGSCGSCWAFSAVGIVESQYNFSSGNPNLDLDLSEQYLVSDCSTSGSCSGGNNAAALTFIKDNGVPDEGCFPYTASNGPCSGRCSDYSSRLKTVEETGSVANNIATIKQYLVEKGPLSAAMGIGSDVGGYFDGNGIYRSTNHIALNHAVVISGYNDTGNYWIVKNSWGTGWGDNGYFKVGYGECGIESYVYYASTTPANPPATPTMTSPNNGDNVAGASISFQWSASTGASMYWLEVNSDPNWGSGTRFYYAEPSTNSKTVTGFPNNGTKYYWRVWAGNSNGWSTATPGWSVVNGTPGNGPPSTPALTSPADGAEVSLSSITLQWQAPSGATMYWLEVNRDPNWGTAGRFYYAEPSTNSKTVTGLSGGTTYYWRVWAGNAAGWSPPSPAQSFVTEAPQTPATPALTSPADGAEVSGGSTTLQWNAPSGATMYWLEVNRDPNWGTAGRFYYAQPSTNSKTVTGLSGGTTYYWRVWAGNAVGWSPSSPAQSFVTEAPQTPATPTLTSPADGAEVSLSGITLQWSAPSGATMYWLEVNRDPNWGTAGRFYYAQPSTNSKTVTGLSGSTTYYWRVWAGNAAGWSAATDGWIVHN